MVRIFPSSTTMPEATSDLPNVDQPKDAADQNGSEDGGNKPAPPTGNVPTLPASAQHEIELVFVEKLPPEYECPVCKQVLRSPVQFEECGHHVCSNCLPELVRFGGKCPADGIEVNRDTVYVNKQLQKTIQNLQVKCSYCDRSCGWEGKLKELPGHLPDCQYAPVECSKGCGVLFERRYQQQHLSEDCGKRIISCEYCKGEHPHEQQDDHLTACPKLPMECPNGCGMTFTRESGEKEYLQAHIQSEPIRHLSLLCDGVVEMKRLMQTMQLNSEKIASRMDDVLMKCDNLEKLYGAQLLWKIEHYRSKFNEAKAGTRTTIFSPPFLTGRHGYKMALSACLYGDGKARGKYMSIFACLCRGEYDALLSWPFSHKVTFTLMDQCQDPAARHNITYTVQPNTCKENLPFLGRATGERNASFGAQRFCELQMLEKLDYVRDDVVFIKVRVETEDMTPI